MSKRARWIVVVMATAAAGVAVRAAAEAEQAEANDENKPALLVLGFHADWCGLCKQMAEPEAEARKRVSSEPALFVNLDLTDEDTRDQARMLAAVLGLSEVYAEYGERTGFALLIDAETRQVVGRLTAHHSADEMTRRITEALRRASVS